MVIPPELTMLHDPCSLCKSFNNFGLSLLGLKPVRHEALGQLGWRVVSARLPLERGDAVIRGVVLDRSRDEVVESGSRQAAEVAIRDEAARVELAAPQRAVAVGARRGRHLGFFPQLRVVGAQEALLEVVLVGMRHASA